MPDASGGKMAATSTENCNASRRDDCSMSSLDRYRILERFDSTQRRSLRLRWGAYRAIIKRFPGSEAANIARERLKIVQQELAR